MSSAAAPHRAAPPAPGETQVAVPRNDWGVLTPPSLGSWQPRRSVSVVVPAHGGRDKLAVVLAGLAGQTYPAHLVEVVVVDDGSRPPLVLPEVLPERTRLVRVEEGWGTAVATEAGIAVADGDVVHRLDSDMLLFAEHLEAHLRWHHLVDYAVVLGAKRFVDDSDGLPAPADVRRDVAAGRAEDLFDVQRSLPHEWVETVLHRTDDLRRAGVDAHRISVGASISFPRELHALAGGLDPQLRLGSDSEFGYRLAQAGALFVYDREAQSWHLGQSAVMRDAAGLRYRLPFVVDTMPRPRYRRREAGRQYRTPYVEVVVRVPAADSPDERSVAAVMRTLGDVLGSRSADLRVVLHTAGSAPEVVGSLAEVYASEPRVRLAEEPAPTAFPAPFRVRVAAGERLGRYATIFLTMAADDLEVGLLRVDGRPDLRVERTAAYARAVRLAQPERDPDDVVAELFGAGDVPREEVDAPAPGADPEPWQEHVASLRADAKDLGVRIRRVRSQVRSRGGGALLDQGAGPETAPLRGAVDEEVAHR